MLSGLESQNDEAVSEMGRKVAMLKDVSLSFCRAPSLLCPTALFAPCDPFIYLFRASFSYLPAPSLVSSTQD